MLQRDAGRVRRGCQPAPRASVRRRSRSRRPVRVGGCHCELGEPDRSGRQSGTRRLLHSRFRAQHRRGDHGSQQVRSAARAVGEPRLEGLVGRHPAVPHPRVRPHPPCPSVVHARRHDVPLPERHARRSAAPSEGGRGRQGRATRWRCRDRSRVPRRRSRRHDAHRVSRRSRSGAANVCGSHPPSCSTVSISTRCRVPAGSRTFCSGTVGTTLRRPRSDHR